ncbi:MAG: hypothetical protein LQ338_002116 [Usnochroma carphineum]|nr:MAG: hypothetical protein LQ338_002116 [Usnochroma carphineum]
MSVKHSSDGHTHSKAERTEADRTKKIKKRKRTGHENDESAAPKKKKHGSKDRSHHIEISCIPPKTSNGLELSPFHRQTSSLYLPLPPIAQNHPLQGLCAEHLSPHILTYYPPLRGVLLSFHSARILTTPQQDSVTSDQTALAQTIDEYAAPHVWLTADFLLLRPQRGNIIEGWINLQNEGNIGLVCWNFFTASIERKRLPKDWKWIPGGLDVRRSKKKLKGSDQPHLNQLEATPQVNGFTDAQGHFEDRDGRKVEGRIPFAIKDIETSRSSGGDNGYFSIEGTLLDKDEERELAEAEIRDADSRARRHRRKEQDGIHTISGALVNSSERETATPI